MPPNNSDALKFFKSLADDNPSALACKIRPENDATSYDAEFIARYADKNYSLGDFGSGSGLIINKIADKFGKIVCVEPFREFSRFIEKKDNVEIINSFIDDFNHPGKFDIISAFGLMQYFSREEAQAIYHKFNSLLKDNGLLLMKQQFGLGQTITVDNYSEELGKKYFSQYRTMTEESEMLSNAGFSLILKSDIYPEKFQRWPNTRFFALVCAKTAACPYNN